MRSTGRFVTVALALTLGVPTLASAANKEHAQLLAEIRMIQEQQAQLQQLIGGLSDTLKAMKPEIGLPTSVTANAPTVFPTDTYLKAARNYFPFPHPEELTAWNNLFVPITQGS